MNLNIDIRQMIVAAIAFVTPFLVAGAGRIIAAMAEKSAKQRKMVAKANRAAMIMAKQRVEEAQKQRMEEEIAYYKGWFWLEAKWMAESYENFLKATEEVIACQEEFAEKRRLAKLSRRFLKDGKKFANPILGPAMGIRNRIWKRKNLYNS